MLNGLDLFSGIGGITLGLEPWVKTIAYCENDRYAQAVLLSRMQEGRLPIAPIWDDVGTLTHKHLPIVDIITGGFPCQDISVAGTGGGLDGSRSGLFFEIIRLISELRPRFIFLENVPAITVRGLDRVLLELTALGYDSRWTIVSAAEMGACHIRERWFLLAHANTSGHAPQSEFHPTGSQRPADSKWSSPRDKPSNVSWWEAEPDISRVADGIPHQSHRIKRMGNTVVPIQAREAFKRLMGVKNS